MGDLKSELERVFGSFKFVCHKCNTVVTSTTKPHVCILKLQRQEAYNESINHRNESSYRRKH